jgi:hypothetical protein
VTQLRDTGRVGKSARNCTDLRKAIVCPPILRAVPGISYPGIFISDVINDSGDGARGLLHFALVFPFISPPPCPHPVTCSYITLIAHGARLLIITDPPPACCATPCKAIQRAPPCAADIERSHHRCEDYNQVVLSRPCGRRRQRSLVPPGGRRNTDGDGGGRGACS